MGMNGLLSYSIKETREQLSSLIDQVAIAKKSFMITKFGKPRALISPVSAEDVSMREKQRRKALEATFGMWKDRKDIKDSAKWVAELRHKMSSRYGYGKIFS